jgi:uncharacterized protein YvpB
MKSKLLNVPYFSQLNNKYNPSGACNVTSIAMALHFLGIRGDKTETQLEDQMYKRCDKNGWSRHDPMGLKTLAESYPNVKDSVSYRGTFNDIRDAIDAGHPVVIHGYFTRFGHIVVIRGYDEAGFYVNDPNGEYYASTGNYDQGASGECLHYSFKLIGGTCSPESPQNPSHCLIHALQRTLGS